MLLYGLPKVRKVSGTTKIWLLVLNALDLRCTEMYGKERALSNHNYYEESNLLDKVGSDKRADLSFPCNQSD